MMASDWFSKLTGFRESGVDEIHRRLLFREGELVDVETGKTIHCGRLEVISLAKLRNAMSSIPLATSSGDARLRISEVVADVQTLHASPDNANAVFQVASQFNLLEMISPDVTPEQGVTRYEHDRTQGPACAVACGGGTIYRNYFADVQGQLGQSASRQIDCLRSVGDYLGNSGDRLWKMTNGYALPTAEGLTEVDDKLAALSDKEIDAIRSKLQIGIQWDTAVTLVGSMHRVQQVYCSALPVAYSRLPAAKWERFARLILEAAYEATLCVAALSAQKTQNNTVYLTLLGGGAFGNEFSWIFDAIARACRKYAYADLDVHVVSYGKSNHRLETFLKTLQRDLNLIDVQQFREEDQSPAHFCPGCGEMQKAFLRYPWYFCQDCLNLAVAGDGRRLQFGNMSFSGGLYCKYEDEQDIAFENCLGVLCAIKNRPVIVTEARFGGVVAQPAETPYPSHRHSNLLDLLNTKVSE